MIDWFFPLKFPGKNLIVLVDSSGELSDFMVSPICDKKQWYERKVQNLCERSSEEILNDTHLAK